ncbi:hypothetical protein FHS61_001506 [Altererythrobacter atlanticus]|uniref:Uncharacterized protein n=1 Tax=Croceibacterium atlanticum TaxID=1267766 RepID=A0A0F7KY64_9SPHN|nr:hypothetical protein [Croceibacterium atlanticum]AKH44186.1 hypothetical protein WYH_03167 [Croceibacterium atlanticum]MBB5732497.1 hypothetical protein [Croceibacterium atlanticum]
MISRGAGASWQTVIADLALILFMISVSAIGDGDGEDEGQAAPQETVLANPLPAEGEPIGIYRAGPDALPIADWLEQMQADPRQRLTIMARYPNGASVEAAGAALALAEEAGERAGRTRILLEPGEQAELLAVLAYDDTQAGWHEDCTVPGKGGDGATMQGDRPCVSSSSQRAPLR